MTDQEIKFAAIHYAAHEVMNLMIDPRKTEGIFKDAAEWARDKMKLTLIESAYGKHWLTVRSYVNESTGWVKDIYCGADHSLKGLDCDWEASTFCRPVQLRILDKL